MEATIAICRKKDSACRHHSRTQSPSYARSTERDEGLWPNHIKLASDWPQRNIWFIVDMNKNTQALHEALVSLWRKLEENTLLKLKEQQYEAVRKIVVDNRPQKR